MRKACSRCRRTYDRKTWRALRFVSVWDYLPGEEAPIELRNCRCGTTLAIRLFAPPAGEALTGEFSRREVSSARRDFLPRIRIRHVKF